MALSLAGLPKLTSQASQTPAWLGLVLKNSGLQASLQASLKIISKFTHYSNINPGKNSKINLLVDKSLALEVKELQFIELSAKKAKLADKLNKYLSCYLMNFWLAYRIGL